MAEYVQLRVKREPEPFFLRLDPATTDNDFIAGAVVDDKGKVLKPSESIPRKQVVKISRAILDDDFPLLIPVKPIEPGGKR